jgi:MtfA peptidase
VVHVYDEVLSGEAVQGGPLMLSWRDVRSAGQSAAVGYNVVIHEFAHVLDMATGLSDGMPELGPELRSANWRQIMQEEAAQLAQRVQAGTPTALDPYGCEGPEEFFAVASEAFFVAPVSLMHEHPKLYALLSAFYRQDPAAEMN